VITAFTDLGTAIGNRITSLWTAIDPSAGS
jgi:hypothetical protein